MRLVVLATFFILLLFPSFPAAAGFNYNVGVIVNDERVEFPDQKPFIDTTLNRTYVPLRFVSEKLGAEVDWYQYEKTAVIIRDGQTIKASVDSNQPTINGTPVYLDAPVKLVNSRTVVPLRFMSEILGTRVEWNNRTKMVYIKTNDQSENNLENDIPPGSVVEVTAGTLNVRSGPAVSNSVLGKVNQGDKLIIFDSSQGWFKVELPDGRMGWVSGSFVKIVEEEEVNDDEDDDVDDEEKDEKEDEEQDDPAVVGSTLTDLDVEEEGKSTVATITTTGSLEHNIFTLTGPNRVVVDLYGVEPGDMPESIDVKSDLVSRVRIGHYSENPSIVRLVFDVKQPVMFSAAKQKKNAGTELTLELFVPDMGTLLKGKVIAIDPGHGGSDPGAVGLSGLKEKDVNLAVARLTSDILRENGAKVILTRSSDVYVDLYERTRIAANAGADVFVSIHMNANLNRSIGGTSTYYYQGADDRVLAQMVQAQLLKLLGRRDIGVLTANFAVLRTAAMPAVLVEASFISNAQEENLLKTDSYRAKIAEAVARGIADYFAYKGGIVKF